MVQISTVISDAMVTITALYGFYILFRAGDLLTSGLGFLLIAAAAILGMIRFSLAPEILWAHLFYTALAQQVGVPLIGAAFLETRHRFLNPGRRIILLTSLGVLFGICNLVVIFTPYGLLISGLATLAIIYTAVRNLDSQKREALLALAGTALVLVAGLLIRTRGEWFGIKRLDIFHYSIALSNLLLALSLREFMKATRTAERS